MFYTSNSYVTRVVFSPFFDRGRFLSFFLPLRFCQNVRLGTCCSSHSDRADYAAHNCSSCFRNVARNTYMRFVSICFFTQRRAGTLDLDGNTAHSENGSTALKKKNDSPRRDASLKRHRNRTDFSGRSRVARARHDNNASVLHNHGGVTSFR